MDVIDVIKIMLPAVLSFSIGIAITPLITHFLYKYKVWKTSGGKIAMDGTEAKVFNHLHSERERLVPRMGGIVIWMSTLITVVLLLFIQVLYPTDMTVKMSFLSRGQTWIPFFVFLSGAFMGFFSDVLDLFFHKRGIKISRRLFFVALISAFVGWWFYAKLGVTGISIPFSENSIELGWLIIPFFMLMSLSLYSSGVIDGIDGLSGGVFLSIFIAYTGIAFYQSQFDLAAFSATIAGSILAFLWFNIPPARFFMTETGTMGITLVIATIAFMTDSLGGGIGISALPIIGMLLVVTVLSDIIQVLSKRFFNKKVFLIAPLHHHFEAIGWPSYKVAMRYWVLSAIFALTGFIFALIG